MTKHIPEGFNTITAQLTVKDGDRAIDFYKRAFGAEELMRMPGPDGKTILHSELRIGNSIFFLNDELPEVGCRAPESLGGTTGMLNLYVNDVDAAFARALAAGAQVRMPVTDMFWGDRYCKIADPFGHQWSLATHTEDLRPEEIRRRAERYFAQSVQAGRKP